MPFVIPPTLPGAENLELDGLPLNDNVFGLEEFTCPPPRQRQEWIGAADSEAQLLVRTPKHENREITAVVHVTGADRDGVQQRVAEVVDALQAAVDSPDGVELVWQPGGGTIPVTFDVLAGEITDLPFDQTWSLANTAKMTIRMIAKPYWRGEETLTSTTSASTPIVTAEIANLIGDVPALGRLIITDTATQSRRHVEWGLEGPLTYGSGTSLLLTASSDLVVSGFAGTKTTGGAGVYGTAPNQIEATARTSPTALCGVGVQAHVGSFRAKARGVWQANTQVRFSYQLGFGPMISNAWVDTPTFVTGSWGEVDLGTFVVPAVLAGAQRWTGQVEVRTTTGTTSVYLNYLELIPTSAGYGKARASYSYTPGVLSGFDDFSATSAALDADTADLGGNWATSGSATDLAIAVAGTVTRSTAAIETPGRFAILGSTNYTDTQVAIRFYGTYNTSVYAQSLIARWVDSSNYLRLTVDNGTSTATVRLVQVVAGVTTTLAIRTWVRADLQYRMRLSVFASGRAIGEVLDEGGTSTITTIDASSSALATGGTLDDGKPGFHDWALFTDPMTRSYSDFSLAVPSAEPIVVYSGRNMQVRHDDTIRQDSTGTYTGRPQAYRGSRFLVPVGTSRVLVKARRNDIEAAADDNVTDATQIQIGVTPRGLAVPRA